MKIDDLKTEVNIKQFAKSLANEGDDQQAEFFNQFGRELKVCCKDTRLEGNQPCYISDKLDSNGIDLINSLAEFIKLRKETEPK